MARKKVERAKMDLNITSMLDVVFNLILFFIVISNFASADLPKMKIPQPDSTVAREDANPNRVVVNIVPVVEGQPLVKAVTFGMEDYKNRLPELTTKLSQEVAKSPDVQVVLRADQAIPYSEVTPIMEAIARSNVKTVNLSASSQKE